MRRKWSLTGNLEDENPTPTEEEMRYLAVSLKEYQIAKAEKSPDDIVNARSEMLQLNIDQ